MTELIQLNSISPRSPSLLQRHAGPGESGHAKRSDQVGDWAPPGSGQGVTFDLARLVLLDSTHLQLEEARHRQQRGGRLCSAVEPLYCMLDTIDIIGRFGRPVRYGRWSWHQGFGRPKIVCTVSGTILSQLHNLP
jgi:hypothetical protein